MIKPKPSNFEIFEHDFLHIYYEHNVFGAVFHVVRRKCPEKAMVARLAEIYIVRQRGFR